ncbi:MAG TPA: helix-turn-helix transcriptional regulator [Longimicrobiales bacterium]|nr:helix-turn-helix transcriptional regulator [Longimicrobiales bacterium]
MSVGLEVLREALRAPRVQVGELAQALGRSRQALWAWEAGTRHPRDADVLSLAEWLNGHAEKLQGLAHQLREQVGMEEEGKRWHTPD